MSAYPAKCRQIHNSEAFRAISQNLVGQFIRFDYQGQDIGYGEVLEVKTAADNTKKSILIEKPDGNPILFFNIQPYAKISLIRFRNQDHMKGHIAYPESTYPHVNRT